MVTGRAHVLTVSDSALRARLRAWRLIDQIRIAALRGLSPAHRANPTRIEPQTYVDVELLGKTLVALLREHDRRGHSPYCPTCSTHDQVCPWPCPVWATVLRELSIPPEIPAAWTYTDGGSLLRRTR